MTLGTGVVLNGMLELAQKHYPEARAGERVNAHGELVLAIIIPARTPGEWRVLEMAPQRKKRVER